VPGRLDVRPLLAGAMQGLRRRRVNGDEPVDGPARYVLFGLPIVAGSITTALRVQLHDAGALATACGVLIGALLTSFGAVGLWKERLAFLGGSNSDADLEFSGSLCESGVVDVVVDMSVDGRQGCA
jgi:hypothetical protein